jgi:hypothetical protein
MPAEPRASTPRPCCHHLRCKSLYYRDDEWPGRIHASDTIDYWCGRTNTHDGPDGEVVRHAACQAGRGCHEDPRDQVQSISSTS